MNGLERSYSLEVTTGVTIFRYLLPVDIWRLHLATTNMWVYRLLVYGLIFDPLGFILALMVIIMKG